MTTFVRTVTSENIIFVLANDFLQKRSIEVIKRQLMKDWVTQHTSSPKSDEIRQQSEDKIQLDADGVCVRGIYK